MPDWLQMIGFSVMFVGIFFWNLADGQGVLRWGIPIPDRKSNPRWFWAVQSFWLILAMLLFLVGLGDLLGLFPL
ncbi:MAG: hypothetical protein AAFX54_02955 [Pseudomonadota bacterium]